MYYKLGNYFLFFVQIVKEVSELIIQKEFFSVLKMSVLVATSYNLRQLSNCNYHFWNYFDEKQEGGVIVHLNFTKNVLLLYCFIENLRKLILSFSE